MDIRFFEAGDFQYAVEILEHLSIYYLDDKASPKQTIAKNLQHNILSENSGVKLILAVEKNQAIAMATISLLYPAPQETAQLFIKELFVIPSHQRKGVGKKLMQFIANYAEKNHCSRLDLAVDSDNRHAIDFYHALGMQPLPSKLYYRANPKAITEGAKHF